MSDNKKNYITTDASSTYGNYGTTAGGTIYVAPNTTDHVINTGVQSTPYYVPDQTLTFHHSRSSLTVTIDEMLEKLTNIEKLLKLVDIDAVLAEKYPELAEAYNEYERLRDKVLTAEAIKQPIDNDNNVLGGDSCVGG